MPAGTGVGDPTLTVAIPTAQQVWAASGVAGNPVLIANLSTTATVYVGYSSSISPSGQNVVPVAPQQAIAFDGSRTIYAVALASTPILILPGATQYFSGNISISNSNLAVTVTGGTITATVTGSVSIVGTPTVSISGTPTVTISGTASVNITNASVTISPASGTIYPIGSWASLLNVTAQNIPASGNYTSAVINVSSYTSYSFNLNAFTANGATAGASLVSQILLTWYADAAGTIPVWSERWWGWLGNSAANLSPVQGSGPMRGPYITVKILNTSATAAYTANQILLYGTGIPLAEPDWRQNPPAAITGSGFALLSPGLPFGDDGVLLSLQNFVPTASSILWQPLALCTGNIYLRASQSVAFAGTNSLGSAIGLTNGGLTNGVAAPGCLINSWNLAQEYELSCTAPHAPTYVIVNVGATAPTMQLTIVGGRVAK